MADQQPNKEDISHTLYREVHASGLGPELSTARPVSQASTAAFGQWLHAQLGGGTEEELRGKRQQLGALSGISGFDLGRLMQGEPVFPLDSDHIQRLATALLEMRLISEPNEIWAAAGWNETGGEGTSDYIVPPSQVVRSMSGNT